MISLLMMGIPVVALIASIRYANRHQASVDADVHRRFGHGLWIGHGHG